MTACLALLLALAAQEPAPRPAQEPDATPAAGDFRPDPAWKPLGRSLWFDPAARRLVLRARVVQTDAPLEHFLCLKGTKEHESILTTDAAPRQIHAGLLLTGAEPGKPVRFRPEFRPPSGTPIAIEVEWTRDAKTHRADARSWVRDVRGEKPLATDWVFAGSELYKDPRTEQVLYAADEGDLITVANFPSAILDVPFASDASDAARLYAADPAAVPPIGTPVTVYLAPRARPEPAERH